MALHNFVERKPDGSGFVLNSEGNILVEAPDISTLVENIIEAKKNGLIGGIYTGMPTYDQVKEPEYLSKEEHIMFWQEYGPRIFEYRNRKN